MRVVIVQPPRKYWPYTSEGDNFLLQQALPALAAPLRAAGMDVHVIDCMPLHIGWRSLADELRRLDPDVICSGENHALYSSEALKFFRWSLEQGKADARSLNYVSLPDALVQQVEAYWTQNVK